MRLFAFLNRKRAASMWHGEALERGDIRIYAKAGTFIQRRLAVGYMDQRAVQERTQQIGIGVNLQKAVAAHCGQQVRRGEQADSASQIVWTKTDACSPDFARDRLPQSKILQTFVAQMLNYSSFGVDEGLEPTFWYRDASEPCVYHIKHPAILGGGKGTRDLNSLDPRLITFRHEYSQLLWGYLEQLSASLALVGESATRVRRICGRHVLLLARPRSLRQCSDSVRLQEARSPCGRAGRPTCSDPNAPWYESATLPGADCRIYQFRPLTHRHSGTASASV